MKPSPRQDFPVGVTAARDEAPAALADILAGIHSVSLNHTISVDRRAPWPPELPEDVDTPGSADEARRTAIRLARYAVTPDAQRAGSVERLASEDGGVVFFVEPAEFDAIAAECEALEETLGPGVHDAVPVSRLAGSRMATFLLERFVPSGYLSEYELRLLGRAPG
jgi:hypothetical protein